MQQPLCTRTPIERVLFKSETDRNKYEDKQRARGYVVYFNYKHTTSSGHVYEVARVQGGVK